MADQTVRIDLVARYRSQALGQAAQDLRKLGAATTKASDEAHGSMYRLGIASQAAGTAILLGVGAALAVSAKAAIDFESQFAGVRKTVDASEATFQRLAQTLRDMALGIPIGLGDLTRIAELGGQLGIPVASMEEFTETIAKLGVTTDLSTEDAATGIARLANVMGTNQGKFDNLGSAIVDLGNNFATTEPEILNFGLRLAGIGSTIGLTEGDVLGLATAFTSLGEPAERGSTAIQRTFVEMQTAIEQGGESLELFAEVAGLTAQEFTQLFRDDPAQAFLAFEKGLNNIIESGGSATTILDDLGLGSQRVLGLLLKGASGWRVLEEAITTGNDAFRENIALDEEAEKRFETTASQITLMGNAFKDMTIEIGQATTGFVNFSVGALAQFFTLIGDNTEVLEGFIHLIGVLAVGKVLAKMGTAFLNLAETLKIPAERLAGFTSKLNGFKAGLGIFTGVLSAAITGFALFGLAIAANRQQMAKYQKTVEATVDALEALREGTGDMDDVVDAFVSQLNEPTGLLDRTIDLEQYRRDILSELGMTLGQMVELAINDFEGFEERINSVIAKFRTQRESILREAGVSGNITTRSAETGLTPEDAALVEELARKEALFAKILTETAAATSRVREEAALRREEFTAELRAANDGRAFIDTWGRFGGADRPFGGFIEGLTTDMERYNEITDEIVDNTGEFVDEFMETWADFTGEFVDRIFDWGAAWDGYERVQAIKTSELKTSLQNWVKDQQLLTDTLVFVTSNFEQDMVDIWLSLPADLQMQLAAAFGVSEELFREQFGLITTTSADLWIEVFRTLSALVPTGGQMLADEWATFFNNDLMPLFGEAGVEGSEAWMNQVTQALLAFDQNISQAEPEVAAALQTLLDDAVRTLQFQGISANVVQEITKNMTLPEKIQWFKDMGFDWEQAALLGWYSGNLAFMLEEDAKDAAEQMKQNPELYDKFLQTGQTWGEARNAGYRLVPMSDPDLQTLGRQELNDKFYQAGRGWAIQATAGFKSYDMGKELADKVSQAAAQANAAAEKAWGMQSPSKVFMEYGRLVGEGFNIGLGQSLVKPAEALFAKLVPDMTRIPKPDRSGEIIDAMNMVAKHAGSDETNIIFNGRVENEGEVMRKVQKGVGLAGLRQIAETAPGRN